jgi:hypothetical protein
MIYCARVLSAAAKTFLAFTCMLLMASFIYGQTKEDQIRQIRTLYSKINSDHSLKTIVLNNADFLPDETPDGGCSLTGYYKNDTLYKMSVWIGLSYCIRQYDYYFDNGKPFLVFETEKDFAANTEGRLVYTKLNTGFEGRYYFNGEKIIDIKLKGVKRMDEMPTMAYAHTLVARATAYQTLLYQYLKKEK